MKRALILGNAKSGKSACKLLRQLGYMVYVTDDNQKNLKTVYRDRFMKSLSLIVLSPGIPTNHKLVSLAKEYGIDYLCEFELGVLKLNCPCVMITGTNGKTTTTLLTQKLMDGAAYQKVYVGGNVGVPVTSFACQTTASDIAILEASSFQLEYKKRSSPYIAVFLNIAPDHLSRHGNMTNYFDAKLKVFEGQTSDDFAVINFDDKALFERTKTIPASKYYFSTKSRVRGCFTENDCIYYSDGISTFHVADVSNIKLKGKHNLENVLASVMSAIILGQTFDKIRENMGLFVGLSHRLEWVMDIENVSFFNDSKATNIASTIASMNSMTTDTTVILGGSDKGLEFDDLFQNVPPCIKNFICIGATKHKLIESANRCGVQNVYEADTMKGAVDLAYSLSKNGDTVLLSPAAASYDMFSSFEERGKVFMKIVREKAKYEDKRKKKFKRQKT